ncbi:hypothetical protein BC829DRAFT_418968 [Chytridium lagenaria]|nr:hypothetical protein BC829DRAFT_418968 [Chytridium lagenaria]
MHANDRREIRDALQQALLQCPGVLGFAEKKIVGEREMMLEREEALRVIESAMRSSLESERRDRHALQTYGERFNSIETEMRQPFTAETLLETSFKRVDTSLKPFFICLRGGIDTLSRYMEKGSIRLRRRCSHGHFRQFDPEGQEFLSKWWLLASIGSAHQTESLSVLSRDPQTHEIHITGKFNIQRKHMTVELETRYGFKHELKFLDLKSAIATETILNFYAEKFSEKPPTLDRVLKRDTRRVYNNTLRRRNFRRYGSPTYRLTRNSRILGVKGLTAGPTGVVRRVDLGSVRTRGRELLVN